MEVELKEIQHNGKANGTKWYGVTRTYPQKTAEELAVAISYIAAKDAIIKEFGLASDANFVDKCIEALATRKGADVQLAFREFLHPELKAARLEAEAKAKTDEIATAVATAVATAIDEAKVAKANAKRHAE